MTEPTGLSRENTVVLFAVQALLGLISENMIAVAIQPGSDQVTLRFWVTRIDAVLEEDVDDAAFELDAQFDGMGPLISTEIHVGTPPIGWHTWAGRMIYWAKAAPQ